MNISKKDIDNDTSFILNTMKKEDVIIPSFLSCATPGLLFMAGLTLWQLFVAYPIIHFDKMTKLFAPASAAFSFIVGFFLFIILTNIRGKYLSLPVEVREESLIVKLITKRAFVYSCLWVATNLISGIIVKQYEMAAMVSSVIQLLSLLVIYFVAIVDLGRYDLAILSSAITKWREGGDADTSLHKL